MAATTVVAQAACARVAKATTSGKARTAMVGVNSHHQHNALTCGALRGRGLSCPPTPLHQPCLASLSPCLPFLHAQRCTYSQSRLQVAPRLAVRAAAQTSAASSFAGVKVSGKAARRAARRAAVAAQAKVRNAKESGL